MRIAHHSIFIGTAELSPAAGHDMIVVFLIIVFLIIVFLIIAFFFIVLLIIVFFFIVFLIIIFFFIASNAPSSPHFVIASPFVVIIFFSSRASSLQRQSGK
jgi:hypothetical protein